MVTTNEGLDLVVRNWYFLCL